MFRAGAEQFYFACKVKNLTEKTLLVYGERLKGLQGFLCSIVNQVGHLGVLRQHAWKGFPWRLPQVSATWSVGAMKLPTLWN